MFRFWKIYREFQRSVNIIDIDDLPLRDECICYYVGKDCNLEDYDYFILDMSRKYAKSVSTKSFETFVKDFIKVMDCLCSEDEEID